jgi:hypothetical protein
MALGEPAARARRVPLAASGRCRPENDEGHLRGAPFAYCSDWKNRGRPNYGRRDHFRQPSRGVPGWYPLGGPASRPTGRSPPGSRKYVQTTFGPPPFSGLARVADVGDGGQGLAAGDPGRAGAGAASE